MKSAADRSYCPRLSEASYLLPLIRGYLAAAAPRTLATALDLVPIVEDGLFGYELVPERDIHIYPIIGCNAQGEPVLRKNCYDTGTPNALRLVALENGIAFRGRRKARERTLLRDTPFPNWLAAAESAWAHFGNHAPDIPRQQTPIRSESSHRWLDQALSFAHSHLDHWDPFIEFLGLPNEAQLGFTLRDSEGDRGTLTLQEPATWALRWNAPPETVNVSWSPRVKDRRMNDDWANGVRRPDRRAQCRRTTDRRRFPGSWLGKDRRQLQGRRAMDRHAR